MIFCSCLRIETKNKSRASKQYFKVVRTISSDYNQAFQDKPSTAIRLRGTSCARFNHLNRIGKFRIENFSSLRRIKRDVQVYFDRTGDGKYINEDKEKNVCTVDDIKVERKTTRKATNFRYNFNSRVYNQNVRIDFDSKMNQKRRNRFDPNNRLMIRKEKQNELNVESNSVDQMLLRELRFTSGREILLKRNYQVAQRSQLLVRKKSEHQLVPHIIKAPRDQNWYINLERTAKLNDHGIFYNSYDNSNGEMNLRPVPKSIYISKVLSFIGFQRTFTADMILNTQHILSTLISWNYGLTILSGIFIYDFIKEVTQVSNRLINIFLMCCSLHLSHKVLLKFVSYFKSINMKEKLVRYQRVICDIY